MRHIKRIAKRMADRSGFDILRHSEHATLPTHLRSVLTRLGIDLVLDVGAHEGEYGRTLRSIGYLGRIVSFEPVARVQNRDDDWTVRKVAIGDTPDVASFNVAKDDLFSSLFLWHLQTSPKPSPQDDADSGRATG